MFFHFAEIDLHNKLIRHIYKGGVLNECFINKKVIEEKTALFQMIISIQSMSES